MKPLLQTLIVIVIGLMACRTMNAQSLNNLLYVADSVKLQYGETDDRYIKALSDVLSFCSAHKDYQNIIAYAPGLLDIYDRTGQSVSSDYLESLYTLIWAYHNTNNYLNEYSLYGKCEELADRLNLKLSDSYWEYLLLKSETLAFLYKEDEYGQTIPELKALTDTLYGENSKQALLYNTQVANQYAFRGRGEAAQYGIERCYAILSSGERLFEDAKDSLMMMSILHNLEGMVYTASDTRRAEEKLLKSIEEHHIVGTSDYAPWSNLGYLYLYQKRDFKRAVECFEQARESLEKTGDNYSVNYLTVLQNLGSCYQELGKDNLAIAVFDLASTAVLNNYGKQHVLYGTVEQNKSVFYTRIGEYSEAIEYCKEALQCFGKVYGENSVQYASCLQNLGLMYQSTGDYSNSKTVLQKAVPILESHDSPYCIYAYINLLTAYAFEKDMAQVKALTDLSIAKLKEHHWEQTDVAAYLYGSIGYVMLLNGMSEAKAYLAQALNILDQTGVRAGTQYYTGFLYFILSSFLDNSQSEEIIPVLTEYYRSFYLDNAAYLNADERESLIAGNRFSQTKNILFSLRQNGWQDTELYNFLLFNKGLLLETSVGYARAVYSAGDSGVISKYERLRNLNRYINGEPVSTAPGVSLEEARKTASGLERGITMYLRQNNDYTDELDYTFSDIVDALDKRDAAIEFVVYHNVVDNKSYYAAMLARKDYRRPRFVVLCPEEDLDKLMGFSLDTLYGKSAVSEELYDLIWSPLVPYLTGTKTVYFSPAGCLNMLSVENLYDGEKRFYESYNAVRVSSTREVCREEAKRKYASAVLYGGLVYDEDEATMIAESRKWGLDTAVRSGWRYLSGTLDEVNRIAAIMSQSKWDYKLFISEKGNEESFKALSGGRFDVLHMATHGFYKTEKEAERSDFFINNPFMAQNEPHEVSSLQRTGLLMSGGNMAWNGGTVPEGVEDGVLTAAEIASLDFSFCDLVVLSACKTGLGEITDEGVYGLQRAFKNAGVSTIIMSLWEVNDEVTSLMMQEFYSNLVKGKSKRESFYDAQNEVRKKYDSPYYWAAFIMLD